MATLFFNIFLSVHLSMPMCVFAYIFLILIFFLRYVLAGSFARAGPAHLCCEVVPTRDLFSVTLRIPTRAAYVTLIVLLALKVII